MQATIQLPPELTSLIQTMVRDTVAEMLPQQKQPDAPDFMNIGEAADYLHISRGTMNKIIKRGDVKVTFINSAKRISRLELQRYMKANQI